MAPITPLLSPVPFDEFEADFPMWNKIVRDVRQLHVSFDQRSVRDLELHTIVFKMIVLHLLLSHENYKKQDHHMSS